MDCKNWGLKVPGFTKLNDRAGAAKRRLLNKMRHDPVKLKTFEA